MSGFSDIIGQNQMKEHLRHALRTGRISHAYLFTGAEGMGKKMVAGTFARTILCENRQERDGMPEACGTCPACVMTQAGTHPDLRILTHEKKTYGIDEVRTQFVQDIVLKPMKGEHRVYIIPEADRMTAAVQNAILKTLEEPPAYAVILLLTERPDALLATILSRTVQLPLKPVSDKEIEELLKSRYRIPDYLAHECAAVAAGNVGLAIGYSGSDRLFRMVEQTAGLLSGLDRLMTADMMERLSEILLDPDPEAAEKKKKTALKDAGDRELERFLDLLMILNRDAMVYKATGDPEKLVFTKQLAYDREAAKKSWFMLDQNNRRIEEARRRLQSNVNTDLTLELLLLGMKGNLDE
ncbi:MAG: DNA polymerase III subunit delta' [Lachnospiraceae bacterium]|nr:DNA polymerase III subunit delta' [Lachnospiraceae bacterium]